MNLGIESKLLPFIFLNSGILEFGKDLSNSFAVVHALDIPNKGFKEGIGSDTYCLRAFGLVAMIPALGAGGPGFKSRIAPTFYSCQMNSINR